MTSRKGTDNRIREVLIGELRRREERQMRRKIRLFFFAFVYCLCNFFITGNTKCEAANGISQIQIKDIRITGPQEVTLQWKQCSRVKGLEVCMSTGKNGSYRCVRRIKDPKQQKAKVRGLTPGRTYYFKMRAYKESGRKRLYGPYSKKWSAKIRLGTTSIKKVALETRWSIGVSWKKVPGCSGYRIYRKADGESESYCVGTLQGDGSTGYTDWSVSLGKSYTYQVSAYVQLGSQQKESARSKAKDYYFTDVFEVTPDTLPYEASYMQKAGYNSDTNAYYMLLSYLDLIEKIGGGTLRLGAGTYELCQPLYITSNTTVYFSNDVVVKSKGESNFFIFADPKYKKWQSHYYEYNGVHDINLIGEGNATIDKEYKSKQAILMAHNKNILIQGLTFRHMNDGSHFIELDASQNVRIDHCTFCEYRDGAGSAKEAINLDVPDVNTGGFSGKFSSFDKTANDTVYIENNVFEDLPAAIGTHMYTPGKMHKNIKICNNQIRNCTFCAVRMMNWENAVMTQNQISGIGAKDGKTGLVFDLRGIKDPDISGNIVTDSDRFMQIQVAQYKASAIKKHPALASYEIIYNQIAPKQVIQNQIRRIYGENRIVYSNTAGNKNKKYWEVSDHD